MKVFVLLCAALAASSSVPVLRMSHNDAGIQAVTWDGATLEVAQHCRDEKGGQNAHRQSLPTASAIVAKPSRFINAGRPRVMAAAMPGPS